jgi:hypothetical protein
MSNFIQYNDDGHKLMHSTLGTPNVQSCMDGLIICLQGAKICPFCSIFLQPSAMSMTGGTPHLDLNNRTFDKVRNSLICSIMWIIFIVSKLLSIFVLVYSVMAYVQPSTEWFSTQWWPSEHHNAWKFHIYRSVSDLKCILYLPLDRAAYLQAQNLTVTHGIVLWYHGITAVFGHHGSVYHLQL